MGQRYRACDAREPQFPQRHHTASIRSDSERLGPGEEMDGKLIPTRQFLRTSRVTRARNRPRESNVDERHDLYDDWAIIVRWRLAKRAQHGTTDVKLTRLLATRASAGTVHRTKSEADEDEAHRAPSGTNTSMATCAGFTAMKKALRVTERGRLLNST